MTSLKVKAAASEQNKTRSRRHGANDCTNPNRIEEAQIFLEEEEEEQEGHEQLDDGRIRKLDVTQTENAEVSKPLQHAQVVANPSQNAKQVPGLPNQPLACFFGGGGSVSCLS